MENIHGEIVRTGSVGIEFNDIQAINKIREQIQTYQKLLDKRGSFIDKTHEDMKKSMEIFSTMKDVLTELRKIDGFEQEKIEKILHDYEEILERYKRVTYENYADRQESDLDELFNSDKEEPISKNGNTQMTAVMQIVSKISKDTQYELEKNQEITEMLNRIDSLINEVNTLINMFETQCILMQEQDEHKLDTTALMSVPQKSWSENILDRIRNWISAIIGKKDNVVATVDYKEVEKQGQEQKQSFRESLSIDENEMNALENNSKSNFTFLTEEQCFGEDKLDIFKKRGIKAAITDFSVLLGGWLSGRYVEDDSSLEGRTGDYWTKSGDGNINACVVNVNGAWSSECVSKRSVGVRPALMFSSIDKIPTNGESRKRARDGILEVEYGYYPQKAAPRDMQEKLEIAYRHGSISKTINSYTTDSRRYYENYERFAPKQHEEYEYNGKRYVRVEANAYYFGDDFTLSNGENYSNRNNVWIEVLPVKWLVDEKAHMMITEKLIFAGVQYNGISDYHRKDFDKTDIKRFMDTHFSRDLLQSRSIDDRVA